MKKMKFAIVIALVASLLFAVTGCGKKNDDTPTTDPTDEPTPVVESATLILVLEDESEVTYTLHSLNTNLRQSMFDEGLISEETFASFFIEDIDGHVASAEEGVLWYLCDSNKNPLNAMAEDVTVKANDTYYFIYTVAPNFDD